MKRLLVVKTSTDGAGNVLQKSTVLSRAELLVVFSHKKFTYFLSHVTEIHSFLSFMNLLVDRKNNSSTTVWKN